MADEKLDTKIRREQIAETAMQIVASQGIKRLSIAALARRIGLVPSGIYRHFRSKDEILDAILDRIEQRLLANVEAARAEAADPLEILHGVLIRHVRFIREGRAIPRIIFSDDFHDGRPDRRKRVLKMFRQYQAKLVELIRQAQQQGKIRAEIDPEIAALMIFGIVVPAGILWHLTDGGFDVTRHAKRAWTLFREMVQPRETPQINNCEQ
ncbi:MAG: TetR/AcrR family transcriptional regulator [Pirellulales bacterium]|nr:TetR/AcrR family transcriptional regulator [Pirellulales bacterium]